MYPKFRADDRDGNPLEGGKLFSYLAGTSTPQAMYADAALTQPLTNPIILDASGEALFYTTGQALKWVLRDQDNTLLWEIDPAVGGAGGGASGAGMGFGKSTVELRASAGASQVSALVFPAGVLAMALTVWCSATFGTSQGLQAIGVGTAEQPDCWGVLDPLLLEDESSAGTFLVYGGKPMPASGLVTLTAYGGLFDSAGAVYLTGHFVTFRPGHTVGYSYDPGEPAGGQILPPLPLASETVAGLVELATVAEATTGTDTQRAVTPAGLQAKFASLPPVQAASETVAGIAELATQSETATGTDDARSVTPLKLATRLQPLEADVAALEATDLTLQSQLTALAAAVPAGTALSLPRYAVSGATLETAPGLSAPDTGRLGVGVTPEAGYALQVQGPMRLREAFVDVHREASGASFFGTTYHNTAGTGTQIVGLRTRGSQASPTAVTTGTLLLRIGGRGHDGTSIATAMGAYVDLTAQETWSSTARGTSLTLSTTLTGTTTLATRLTIDGLGNLTTWGGLCGLGTPLTATLGAGATYQALSVKGSTLYVGQSSVQERPMGLLEASWISSTDATRTARLTLSAYDATAAREGLRLEADASAARLGFYGSAAVVRPTVSAAATDAATTQTLANSLRTALLSLGLCV